MRMTAIWLERLQTEWTHWRAWNYNCRKTHVIPEGDYTLYKSIVYENIQQNYPNCYKWNLGQNENCPHSHY